MLADERVSQQRLEHALTPALMVSAGANPLRRDVGNEAGEEWGQPVLSAAGSGPSLADARWHLDDCIISEEGQRAVVAQIDHLDITSDR